ncbi:hypothetical protein, partial [Cognatiyoonia sp.]|uniref:hypothetical protein n=1 Tax=Cognatiyoonia sp. TaxID=2211652 RepID=UPI003F69EEFA
KVQTAGFNSYQYLTGRGGRKINFDALWCSLKTADLEGFHVSISDRLNLQVAVYSALLAMNIPKISHDLSQFGLFGRM